MQGGTDKLGKTQNYDLLQFLACLPDSTVGIHDLHEVGVQRGHDDAVLPFSKDPIDQLAADTHAFEACGVLLVSR